MKEASQPVLSLRQSQRTIKKRRYTEDQTDDDDDESNDDSSKQDSGYHLYTAYIQFCKHISLNCQSAQLQLP